MARDWDVLDDVRDRLLDTKEFDEVYRSSLPETQGRAADDLVVAVVRLHDWEEVDESDDETDVQSTHRARWSLTVIVREDDAELRERKLDRLLNVAQKALDGRSLADGLTIPDWTRIRRGAYEAPTPPEQRMTATGEFAYWIEGFDGRDVTDV